MKKTPAFSAGNIVAGYDKKIIINDIDMVIPNNKISVIIGANACGKSTLLKTLARLIKPVSGEVVLDGKQIGTIPPKQLARVLGLLPQSPVVPEGITVSDLVSRGRYPYQNFLKGLEKKDYEAVEEALEIMGIVELANRSVDELSGGQRQRVWIAMALAQQTDLILLDEPTTYLDMAHQLEVLELLYGLNRSQGCTIAMVLHDLNLAARFSDYMIAVREGKIVQHGSPEKVMTAHVLKETFSIDAEIVKEPRTGRPVCLTYALLRQEYLSPKEAVSV